MKRTQEVYDKDEKAIQLEVCFLNNSIIFGIHAISGAKVRLYGTTGQRFQPGHSARNH